MAVFYAVLFLYVWAFSGLSWFVVDGASNITSCDPSSNSACIQGPCGRSMFGRCSLQCDQSSNYDLCSQYCDHWGCDTIACDAKVCLQNCSSILCDNLYCSKNVINCEQHSISGKLICEASTCNQSCDNLFCKAIECRSSDVCNQFCNGSCKSLLCDAKTCLQNCNNGFCSNIKCSKDTINCTQVARTGKMMCKANLCQQVCDGAFCSSLECQAGEGCSQRCSGFCDDLKCENSPICHQTCNSLHCSTVTCSKNVIKCEQYVRFSRNGELICGANSCYQNCHGSSCNVSCPSGVQTCIQNAKGTVVEMTCNADVCNQVCSGTSCKMTCLSNVTECVQVCGRGSCDFMCDASNCKLDCTAARCKKIGSPNSGKAFTGSSLRVLCMIFLVVSSFIFM